MDDDFEVAVPNELHLKTIATEAIGPIIPPVGPEPPVDGLVVTKSLKPFELGWYNPGNDDSPQHDVFNNKPFSSWLKNTHTYKLPVFGGGTSGIFNADVSLYFSNYEAIAKDITVSIGGVSADDALPPTIGGNVKITIPDVPLVEGYQLLDVIVTVPAGRVILDLVDFPFLDNYVNQSFQAGDLSTLLDDSNPGTTFQDYYLGSYFGVRAVGGATQIEILAPSNHAIGTRANLLTRYGGSLNGVEWVKTGPSDIGIYRYMPNLSAPMAVGDKWTFTAGTSTNWIPEIFAVNWWIDTSLPVPQGNDSELETIFRNKIAEPQFVPICRSPAFDDLDTRGEEDKISPQGNCCPKPPRPPAPPSSPVHVPVPKERPSRTSFDNLIEMLETIEGEHGGPPVFTKEGDVVPQGDDTPEERNDDKDEANAPIHETVDLSMGPSSAVPGLNQIYFGEQISSWRQMLKRYTQKLLIYNGSEGGIIIDSFSPPNGELGPNGAARRIDTYNHLLDYVMPAYICQRGGMKYRFWSRNNDTLVSLTRLPYEPGKAEESNPPSSPQIFEMAEFSGSHIFDMSLAHNPSVEIPWYSKFRFLHARNKLDEDPTDFIERGRFRYKPLNVSGDVKQHGGILMAVAEDFSLSGYLSAPVLKYI
jgi:hypothetical protein